ncbi:MAG TPA: hypothetical protein VEC14_07830 [Reyranellaceae bacterium]|nr:hypothetical protein [Reyranellaceae bacterium]
MTDYMAFATPAAIEALLKLVLVRTGAVEIDLERMDKMDDWRLWFDSEGGVVVIKVQHIGEAGHA